jgi:archaellum component FlaC
VTGRLDGVEGHRARGDERFDGIDERFDRIDETFDRIDERFDRIDEHFDRINEHFDRIDERFDRIDGRLDSLLQGQGTIQGQLNRLEESMRLGFQRLEEGIEILKGHFVRDELSDRPAAQKAPAPRRTRSV